MAKILCMDSEADETTKTVAEWRKDNVYPHLQANGHDFESLNGTMAVRVYLEEDLKSPDVVLFTGSGHGFPDEYQGSDGFPALKVSQYSPNEVKGKVIHLLSCNTAQVLGGDTVKNGCNAFLGYDLPFSFHHLHLDLFLQPDAALVKALAEGKTVKEACLVLEKEYETGLEKLNKSMVNEYIIADMETNRDHFRSPTRNKRWGNENTSIK